VEPIIGTTALGSDKGTWNASEYRYVKGGPESLSRTCRGKGRLGASRALYAPDQLVPLRIDGYELELRSQVKAAGGKWNPEKQLWFVNHGKLQAQWAKASTCR